MKQSGQLQEQYKQKFYNALVTQRESFENFYKDQLPYFKQAAGTFVEELDERPYYQMQENYKLILKHLKTNPQTIIVDEVDYLIGSKNAIEILRDIQDCTGSPLVLVGMGLVDRKISRLKHFDDRLFKKLRFEHFNQDDISDILKQLTDLEFTEDAINYLATRTNQFRKLVQHIDQIEKLANTNQLEVIDEQLMKGVLNERPNIKVVQKTEKMYA